MGKRSRGRPPSDGLAFKIRYRDTKGSRTVFKTDARVAVAFARQKKEEGKLLYFAEYKLTQVLEDAKG